MEEERYPKRRRPAHYPPHDRNSASTIIYVTVNIQSRRPLLASQHVHEAVRQAWQAAVQWKVGYYVIMPDHIHLFCAPGVVHPERVRDWSEYWKRLLSKSHVELKGRWQSDCWDTQIRNGRHYQEKLEYLADNPVRKGLADARDDWPFQGHMCHLPWHGD